MIQLSHPHLTTGKIIALILWTLVGRVMSLFFNTPSRFVIVFLPKNIFFNFMAESLPTVILDPKKIKFVTASTFSPSICHKVMESDAMILVFWILSFKSSFSLYFTLIKQLFSSFSLSAIRAVSSAYLRLLLFVSAILIPACDSSILALHMMNSVYWDSLVAQLVKNLPVMQETWVQSLGWEDPLEKGMATHSSILARRIPWTV